MMKYILLCLLLLNACTWQETQTADIKLHSYNLDTSISHYRNKLILLSFGYTHCPDICPTTLLNVASALKQLSPEEKTRVQAIFITLDPERDTLDKLKEYVGYFDPSIIGADIEEEERAKFMNSFQIESFRDSSDENYQINHTSYLFLVDDKADILDMMSHQTAPSDIAKAIRNKL